MIVFFLSLGIASLALGALGLRAAYRLGARAQGIGITLVVLLLCVHALILFDSLWWARWLPYPPLALWGTSLLPEAALFGGLLYKSQTTPPNSRSRLSAALLPILALTQMVLAWQGSAPKTQAIEPEQWAGGVCPQTSESTCSAASAATVLQHVGITANETEMARLCHTRPSGTLMLGLYAGLREKTASTNYRVYVLAGASQEDLRRATQYGPVLISVGLDRFARGIDPRYERDWGWERGKRHAVVLFGFLPNGKLDIGDPSVGREQWSVEALDMLWHGEGIVLLRATER